MTSRVVVRPGALGDTLLLAPVLEALRGTGRARVVLIGYPERLDLLARAGLADRVASLDEWLSHPASVLSGLGETWIDSFYPTPPAGFSKDPPKDVECVFHPPFPEEETRIHIVDHLGACLGMDLDSIPEKASPLKGLLGKRQGPRVLWIHPGAGSPEKRWPLERFIAFAGEAKSLGFEKVRFFLGEAEGDLFPILKLIGLDLVRPANVKDLSRSFQEGDGFVGNDSGPAQLVSLMGLPTLAVFGPTDPEVWGPRGPRAVGLSSEGGAMWPTLDRAVLSFRSLLESDS